MTLHQLLSILRARLGVAALIVLSVLAVALAWVLLRPPHFVARAAVLVAPGGSASTRYQESVSPGYLSTQIDIVNSSRVAQHAIQLLPADEQPMLDLREEAAGKPSPQQWMVQAIQGLKAGYEQAIKANNGAWPTPEQVAAAMHDVNFKGYGREVKMQRADGQGLEAQLFGVTRKSDKYPFKVLADITIVPAELVPQATTSQLNAGQQLGLAELAGPGVGGGWCTSVETGRPHPWSAPGRWGWTGGSGTSAYVDPSRDLIGVVMSQRFMTGPQEAFDYFWGPLAASVDGD